jgi:ATP-dependent Zn protease
MTSSVTAGVAPIGAYRGPATVGPANRALPVRGVLGTRSHLMGRMAVALAGCAAERFVFGGSGVSAGSDLQNVRDVARRMFAETA